MSMLINVFLSEVNGFRASRIPHSEAPELFQIDDRLIPFDTMLYEVI